MAETLERAGLRVLRAGDGQQAIELFRLQPDAIQVVVLDRTMPNVDGEEAFDQIRRIRSDARIILMSGYSEDSARRSISREIDAFLQKPFEPLTLVDQVRRLL